MPSRRFLVVVRLRTDPSSSRVVLRCADGPRAAYPLLSRWSSGPLLLLGCRERACTLLVNTCLHFLLISVLVSFGALGGDPMSHGSGRCHTEFLTRKPVTLQGDLLGAGTVQRAEGLEAGLGGLQARGPHP